MKRIISIFCVIAMMFSLAISVNANGVNEVTLTIESQTETEVTIAINTNTTIKIATISAYVDLADALEKGATYRENSEVDVNGNSTPQYIPNNKMFQIQYAPTSGARLTGFNKLATFTLDISNVTEAFTVSRKADSGSRIKFKVQEAADDDSLLDIATSTAKMTFNSVVTVEPEEEEVEYEVKDEKLADLVADTTPLVAEDGTKFTNVAKYTGSFNLTDIKNRLDIAGGEELIKVGFKKNGDADTFTSINVSGPGTVEYSFLFYGIADASALDIDTYYTAKKIVVE